MLKYTIGRFLQGVVSMIAVTMLVYSLGQISGDPVEYHIKPDSTLEQYEALRERLGLDSPLAIQYLKFLGRAVRFDFGRSFAEHRMPVARTIRDRLPNTAQLAVVTLVVILSVSIPMGILAALKRQTVFDGFAKAFAVLGQAIPQFWLGIVLIYVFGVWIGILPFAGKDTPAHFILPVFTAAWTGLAGLLRMTRSSMLEVIGADYVRTARAKGLKESVVVGTHAFRNALIPIVTYSSLLLAGMLNGFVLVEVVFAWPGIGLATVTAVVGRDLPMVMGLTMFLMLLYLTTNFLVDVLYGLIDPRIKYG